MVLAEIITMSRLIMADDKDNIWMALFEITKSKYSRRQVRSSITVRRHVSRVTWYIEAGKMDTILQTTWSNALTLIQISLNFIPRGIFDNESAMVHYVLGPLQWRHNGRNGVSNTSLSIVYSTVHQRKHQSSASLAFMRGIHR